MLKTGSSIFHRFPKKELKPDEAAGKNYFPDPRSPEWTSVETQEEAKCLKKENNNWNFHNKNLVQR